MTTYVFANFAFSVLAEPIEANSTLIRIRSTDASKFPTLAPGQAFYCTIWDRDNTPEIVEVTARNAEILTVTRGVDGTAPAAWLTGTPIRLAMTRGLFESIRASSLTTGLSSPTDNQVLTYDGVGLQWINKTIVYDMIPGLQTDLDDLNATLASHTHTAAQIDGGEPVFTTLRWQLPFQLATGYNLNDLEESGWFGVSAPTNGPEGAAGNWLIQSAVYSTGLALEYAYKITSGTDATYLRFRKAGAWNAWAAVPMPGHTHDDRYYTKGQIASVALTLLTDQTITGVKSFERLLPGAGYLTHWYGFAEENDDPSHLGVYQNTDGELELRFFKADGTEYIRLGSKKVVFNVPLEFGAGSTGGAFDGATSSDDGTSGLVPMPEAGQQDMVLHGSGDWQGANRRTYKPADQTVTASATLVNDDDLAFTTTANRRYWFKFVFWVTTNGGADFSFQLDGPGSSTFIHAVSRACVRASGPADEYIDHIEDFSTRIDLVDTTDKLQVTIEGLVYLGGSGGAIKIKWAQQSSDPGDTKVKRGSYVEYGEII
jgi:hypothetical protein